ncbi:glycosyltransferase N-terminal domain-containing protein [Tabrizicola sp.]|uniref:3-deoxy-D-manno-octulosonic acid transferase n=1 Tax=Tabrizicola sp. TaxID=2005166 RepID=UPI0026367CC8|nr:glycosyltransferase N-terminal domain-containing protein [Tabrizicola sp.]MDM7931869.1 glycosyltransferase N-terminal domain-containing protein [Tabrizicola sp.]
MAASLGLKLYNLGNRREAGKGSLRPQRPSGGLAWLHAPSEDQVSPMLALARRLIEEDGIAVVMTCPLELPGRDGMIHQPPPTDTPTETRAFLDHWRPEIVIFSGGELRPALLHEAAERRIPMLLVNGRTPNFLRERDGWYPGLMRSALSRLARIFTVDEAAARQFRKAGAALSAVAVTGRMEDESAALACLEAERAALARLLAARPVWFAAGLPVNEEAAILQAHRTAMQHSHRLLLILMPEDPAQAGPLARRLESDGDWVVAQRMREEEPDAEVEIFVVDSPAEYGLWYRLAPVTYLGGSLSGNGPTRNPMEAAALGSAILHGPRTGRHGPIFDRLGAARATRAVASGRELGEALGDLLAPDRAARLAQSAWAVASEGAEVTERLLAEVRTLMDGGS